MPKFVPRQRKHKVLARQQQHQQSLPPAHLDSNAPQLVPESTTAKEARRAQLREELRLQNSKPSAKKQKRLNKYIETKLRREEDLDYLKRLEQEREKFDIGTASGFTSSKALNARKRRFQDFVAGQVDDPASTSIRSKSAYEGRTTTRKSGSAASTEDSTDEDESGTSKEDAVEESAVHGNRASVDYVQPRTRLPATQGSGLAQPLQLGADGLPVMRTRGETARANRVRHEPLDRTAQQPFEGQDSPSSIANGVESPWEGFSDDAEPEYSSETARLGFMSLTGDDTLTDEDVSSIVDSSEATGLSEDDSGSDTSVGEDEQARIRIRPRNSAFKSWASQQVNQSYNHVPSYAEEGAGELLPKPVKGTWAQNAGSEKQNFVNGLPAVATSPLRREIHSIQVDRSESTQASRNELPVVRGEQEIMEAIFANPVVVIKAETGSGKTTQIPQFLYEAGFGDSTGPNPGLIGVTQPRRVAAVSMAARVAEELGSHGSRVAHQVRFDANVQPNTAVKFMTDGILLRELSQDLLLKKYSAIVIDEAHERSVNTDILIGMLSKIVPARMRKDKFNPEPKPLKLIIMSATLHVEDFLNHRLFAAAATPPIIEAEGRQHRVTIHFALKSRGDYIEEVILKVKRAHQKLPKGGILVFLTGQNEIREVQKRLRHELRTSGKSTSDFQQHKMHAAARDAPLEIDDVELGVTNQSHLQQVEDEVDLQVYSDDDNDDHEFDVTDDEVDEGSDAGDDKSQQQREHNPAPKRDPYDTVHVLPLYSQLPTQEQMRVFSPPPDRSRMIVLATNVAETSLTIPNIRYVFDCGRSKERKYDLESGVQRFEIDYISKASAQQRAGRAGRTGPGHCWRLYSSALYEQYFSNHTEPEILRTPAESVVLQVKSFGYPKPVVEFPFPTTPSLQNIARAEKLLRCLGALDTVGKITGLGRQLSLYPLPPRLAKVLVTAIDASRDGNSHGHGSGQSQSGGDVLRQVIDLVAGLTVGEIFIRDTSTAAQHDRSSYDHPDSDDGDDGDDDDDDDGNGIDSNSLKQRYGRAQATLSNNDRCSDAVKIMTAVAMYAEAGDKDAFCRDYFLRSKAMREVLQLASQLRGIVQANNPSLQLTAATLARARSRSSTSTSTSTRAPKANSRTTTAINNTAAAGYIEQVAIRWDMLPTAPVDLPAKPRRAIDVPYLPLTPLTPLPSSAASTTGSPEADLVSRAIFIHPSSVLSRARAHDLPQYIIYTHLQQSASRTVGGAVAKTRMFPLCPVDAASLSRLAASTPLLEFGKPLPRMQVEDLGPRQRAVWVDVSLRSEPSGSGGRGGPGWPLPPLKVKQTLDTKSRSGWRVDEVLSL